MIFPLVGVGGWPVDLQVARKDQGVVHPIDPVHPTDPVGQVSVVEAVVEGQQVGDQIDRTGELLLLAIFTKSSLNL